MLIDCHNHSRASMDGEFTVSQMVSAAQQKGIGIFAVTDHCELDEYEKHNLIKTVPMSVKEIEEEKKNFGLKLLCGIEIGQAHAFKAKAEEILTAYDFDMVIGSLHSLKNERDFYWIDYKALSDDELLSLMTRYYEELYELASWGKFDTLAHIGYPYRYIIKSGRMISSILPQNFEEKIKAVFELLIKNDKALENNTSTSQMSGENKEISRYFLKLYFSLGGRLVTAGSDAHTLDDVGNGLEEGNAVLKEIGFSSLVYFEKRKPILINI